MLKSSLLQRLLLSFIWIYRKLISPWIKPRCRFLPTCSEYGMDAIREHGAVRGSILTARRVGRCHPWGGSGFDPVPKRKYKQ